MNGRGEMMGDDSGNARVEISEAVCIADMGKTGTGRANKQGNEAAVAAPELDGTFGCCWGRGRCSKKRGRCSKNRVQLNSKVK